SNASFGEPLAYSLPGSGSQIQSAQGFSTASLWPAFQKLATWPLPSSHLTVKLAGFFGTAAPAGTARAATAAATRARVARGFFTMHSDIRGDQRAVDSPRSSPVPSDCHPEGHCGLTASPQVARRCRF